MRDAVADALHLLHQALDFLQHAVDHVDQPVEITRSALRRQPLGEVAIYDTLGGVRHGIDAANRIGPGDRCSAKPSRQVTRPPHSERMDQDLIEMTRIRHVLGDKQQVAGRHATQPGHGNEAGSVLRQR